MPTTSGIFFQASLTAATDTDAYTAPAGDTTTLAVEMVNKGTTTAKIRIGISTTASISTVVYREYDWALAPNYPIIRTFVVGENCHVWLRASQAGVDAAVSGFEELKA